MTSFETVGARSRSWRSAGSAPGARVAHNFLDENRRAAYMNCAIEST